MSANEFVGTSRYSHEWVALSLSESCETFENLRKNAAIQTIDVKEISGKNGFCSKIYHCHIRFVDGNKFDAILKVPETGDMSDVLHDTDGKKTIDEECMALMHKRECRFLTEFAPRVNFPIPKIYQCVNWTSLANPGAILMESFYGKVATVDLVDGFTKPQLVAIAKDLARFQAYFLKLEDKSWVEKCKRTMHPQVQGIYANLIEKLKKDEPETFGADVDAVLPYVKNPDFIQHTFYSAYEAHGLPAVFAHGDLWVNNVLWKTNADGTNANEVATYVDWQLSHAGCLTTDLASALVICTDAHLRRLYTDDILGVYYETLKEEVGDVPFSLNDVKKLFEANFAAQCFTLMICIGHLPAMNGHLPENVQRAQYEKFKVRVKLAVEDLLDIGFPKEFNNHYQILQETSLLMTSALSNLKWVLGSLLENDRHFVYYTKKAPLSNVSAQRDGNVVRIRFDFNGENNYDVTLKFIESEAECLFYSHYSSRSEFPVPRCFGHLKNMLLVQNVEAFGVRNRTYSGLNKQQVYNLAAHLADLHAYHLLSDANSSKWLPTAKAFSGDQLQTVSWESKAILSDKDALSLCTYMKLRQNSNEPNDLKSVCVHGDLTSDNIFWQKDEDGSPKNTAASVVGWGNVHLGSPTDDLAQLLISCVDADERLLIQNSAIELYYNTLRQQISGCDELMQCFTLDKVYKSVKRSFIDQTVKYILALPKMYENLEARTSKGVAEAVKGKLKMRAKFAVMEAIDHVDKLSN
ncbi:hypothetical protein QR680_013839 [Steinernema hermaphroditum]|uniref:CHK kinase-like domain-containing protein n=1 Tax=Steinernema hermaphroditum TaxID=289476 RepID=A0AA39I6V0_9BILA|nr:hypothetical protein QR680_013839 [Steinernema hermaphroditum]